MIVLRCIFLLGLYLAASFAEPDKNDDKVVIVMSHGRGGSTWLCEIISGFDKKNISLGKELFGGNAQQMDAVASPVQEMERFLISERKHHPEGYIGFKWKPFGFDSDKYKAARKVVAERGYKVVMMHRNVLDEFLSVKKHMQTNQSLSAHCRAGDESCIQKHKSVKVDLNIKNLPISLERLTNDISNVKRGLRESGVLFLEISYDELAWGVMDHRLKVLQRIIDYLHPDKKMLATASIFEASKFVSTQERNHSVIIQNYVKVQEALRGTPFEKLLHET